MILGIGNDIVSIERIENLLDKFGERFIKKVFTKEEETRSLKNLKPAASLAKRFAAKEAAWKALGDQKQIGINWKDMGVRNNKSGKPFLELTGKAAEQLKNLTPENMIARIQAMRVRLFDKAVRKGQFQTAAQILDSLGKVVGESVETVNINAPELAIRIENQKDT